MLAEYAVPNERYHEREHPEPAHEYRSEFQRDRDRIVHSKAFRRLEYKTQVFVNHMGDNYRTRLTHSIEVSQIARTVSRSLFLNEDLTETLALAHDLGHPPFGHAGERALHDVMIDHGGFDHNEQSLRVVTLLERRYPKFDGLNLTQATLMGLQKHNLPEGQNHTLESQVVDVCDEIAYNNHDLDDGLDSAHLNLNDLSTIPLWKERWLEVNEQYPGLERKIAIRHTIRGLINVMVTDLIENAKENIRSHRIQTLEDVLSFRGTSEAKSSSSHEAGRPKLVCFSPNLGGQIKTLKDYLFDNLYRHPEVVAMNARAEKVIRRMFDFFIGNEDTLPEEYRPRKNKHDDRYRVVADFIAGMTDRYALFWNRKLLGIDS